LIDFSEAGGGADYDFCLRVPYYGTIVPIYGTANLVLEKTARMFLTGEKTCVINTDKNTD